MLIPSGMDARPLRGGPDSWTEQLNLSPEQAQTLKTSQSRFQQELIQFQKKIIFKRMELKTLSPEEARGEKGEDLRRQIQTLMQQARERSLVYQNEVMAVLTPEQQKQLPPDCDLGFHCGGWFYRGGMRRGPVRREWSPPAYQDEGTIQPR